jgi:flagellar hook assembly protein FlgD
VAAILTAAPNPFHRGTSIRFEAPVAGKAVLTVYDVRGRRVAVMMSSLVDAGPHRVEWDGRGDDGREVGAGVYFAVLRAGEASASRRLVRLR